MAEVGLGNCTELRGELREVAVAGEVGVDRQLEFHGHSAFLLGHRMIVFGGRQSEFRGKVFVFDLLRETWSTHRTERPIPIYGTGKQCVLWDDQVLTFTWKLKRGTSLTKLDCVLFEDFYPLHNGPLGEYLAEPVVGYFQAKEEVVAYNHPSVVFILKLESTTWRSCTTKGSHPSRCTSQMSCSTGTSMYVLDRSEQMTMYSLNMAKHTWSHLSSGSPHRTPFTGSLTYAKGRIYVFGRSNRLRETHVYSISEDRWHKLAHEDRETFADLLDDTEDTEEEEDFNLVGDTIQFGYWLHSIVRWNDTLILLGGISDGCTLGYPLYIRPSA